MSENVFEAYAGRRVLVTGSSGFKGGWLSLWLESLGAQVVGFGLPPATEPSFFEAARVRDKTKHVFGDVRRGEEVARVFAEIEPEVVFHLAAQPIVGESYREPLRTVETNVMGVVNVLDQARKAERPVALVLITSDKCYENRGWVHGYRETDRLGGWDPYSASKAAAEIVIESYRRSFFRPEEMSWHRVAVASVRAGNVIGGGDWSPFRIVPDCVRALSEGRVLQVRNPDSVRPWQHVLEPLSGYLTVGARLLSEKAPAFCEAWNFGPDPRNRRTVRDLVEAVISGWGSGRWEERSEKGFHEDSLLSLAIEKARAKLGWFPRWSFETSIRETVAWYKGFYEGKDMSDLSRRQIASYMSGSSG